MPYRIFCAALLLNLLACGVSRAWSNKEHAQLTRIAAQRLIDRADTPDAMRDWLKKALGTQLTMEQEREYFLYKRIGLVPRGIDGLPYWATMPDMLAMTSPPSHVVAPFGVPERTLHFIDLEWFNPDASKRTYAHDLSHKPRLADFPRDMRDARYQHAGMLPFRVVDCYQKLVEVMKAGKLLDTPGQYPRDEHAAKWAGMLAHYLEDNTQPQHATVDYKSASYFADQRDAPNVHAQVEYVMCDDVDNDYPKLRTEYWPLLVAGLDHSDDPIVSDDTWVGTLQVALDSYNALPLIGMAAMAATGERGTPQHPVGPTSPFDTAVFFHYKGPFRGKTMSVMEMKALQQAWAVHRVEKLWLAAWNDAHPPTQSDHAKH